MSSTLPPLCRILTPRPHMIWASLALVDRENPEPLPAYSGRLRHIEAPGCNCDRCVDARSESIRASIRQPTAREAARNALLTRGMTVQRLGLSNPTYLHAREVGAGGEGEYPPPGRPRSGRRDINPDLHGVPSDPRFLDPRPQLPDGLHELGIVAAEDLTWRCSTPRGVAQDFTARPVPGTDIPMIVHHTPARLVVRVGPGRVRVSVSDALADEVTPVRSGGGKRGKVTALSDASRDRMADTAAALSECGNEAQIMITLTSPANWEQLYLYDKETGEKLDGGRIFKAHMRAFRERLTRLFKKSGWGDYRTFWFLEFQKRGAPHVHLLMFGMEPEKLNDIRKELVSWTGTAWAGIVGNPDELERKKHARACSTVELMRVKHFGYAQKYAAKTEQKIVPDEFSGVGRFWGLWNYKIPKAVVMDVDFALNDANIHHMTYGVLLPALQTVVKYSASYVANKAAKLLDLNQNGLKHRFGFSIYGAAAGRVVCDALGVSWGVVCGHDLPSD